MSCCSCQECPARITNIYRHDELLYKFTDITAISVSSNTFICDTCIDLLEQAYAFKERCLNIYQKSLPDVPEEIVMEEFDEDENIYIEENEEFVENDKTLEQYEEDTFEGLVDDAEEEVLYEIEHQSSPITIVKDEFHETKSSISEANSKAKTPVRNRKAYTSAEKLEAVACAEISGNRKASKVFKIDESCIRKWRSCKSLLIEIDRERGTKRKPNPHWPVLEKELKVWCFEQMSSGIKLKPSEIKAKSIEIASKHNLIDFKGTSSYVHKFMERYRIPGRQNKTFSLTKVNE